VSGGRRLSHDTAAPPELSVRRLAAGAHPPLRGGQPPPTPSPHPAALIDKAKATPYGEKKATDGEMPAGYYPKFVEAAWYEWWNECGFFKPDLESDKPPFVMVIPPPNVTGALHIGHALTNSIEDCIVRYRRMSGYNALWVPGTDHAGIATQTVVEKQLMRQTGETRHDLGREKFVGKVWEWKEDYGGRILGQLKRLGSSVDWSREAFTMDSNLSRAVQEAFVRLFDEGLIYRDNRLVNWCCKLHTAVSDIEVDYIEVPGRTKLPVPGYDEPVEFGALTKFAYKVDDDSGDEIVIATTRPETMLGDTAVAVHPEDPRYAKFHGKHLVHPVSGRKMPIIQDAELVEMDFGTGAVKITPAHDPNDFATGKRHNLEFINILTDDGKMNHNCGPFEGQARFECRRTIVEFMEREGLYRGVEDNAMNIPVCSRSKDIIEPVLKPQWWVDCKDMAAAAVGAVRNGDLEIIPAEFNATWYRWLENIRDWCISRQLWWGHRIPAYYVEVEGEDRGRAGMPSEDMTNWVIGKTEEEALAKAQAKHPGKKVKLVQDEDVLDTWFSSGLFPFSVFQWPDQTKDLAKFYPTSLLETGHDILFFWVARMVMMGMKLTGEVPFKQVYLHSMVRDAHGRKMSKSLGNVIDPINVIEGISLADLHKTLEGGNLAAAEIEKAVAGQKEDYPDGIGECGTDALRFALISYTSQGRDINLDIKRVSAYRNWCNKLWNALKFAMLNIGDAFVPQRDCEVDFKAMPFMCRWVLDSLNETVATTVKAMDAYNFSGATDALYQFWQYKLCDNFIEMSKPTMQSDDEAAKQPVRQALWMCLETGLRLLHPFMPFVTEELWQRLPKTSDITAKSIMIADYPRPNPAMEDPGSVTDFGLMTAVVSQIRSLASAYDLPTKARPEVTLRCGDAERKGRLEGVVAEIRTLAKTGDIRVAGTDGDAPTGCAVQVVDDATTLHVLLKGLLDPAQEVGKLEKKREGIVKKLETLRARTGEESYQANTPEDVKSRDAETLKTSEGELEHVQEAIESMKKMALEA